MSCKCIYKDHSMIFCHKDFKNIKDVGMACQKYAKKGRDDIIVKVNLQSLTLHYFHISLQL